MPRSVTETPIATKAARDRLAPRHQPYWRGLDAGAALGYRKGATAGAWIVRVADADAGGGYRQAVIGRADDTLKADGADVMDFRQAEAKAREWLVRHARVAAGLEPEIMPKTAPYTVADAVTDYLGEYAARGGKALRTTKQVAATHILPTLGSIAVGRLTRDKLRSWHRTVAATPARLRSKAGQVRHRDEANDPDATRRRRSSANRILTVLKAALNHAHAEGKVTCNRDAWAAVKPFKEADQPKVRYLLDDEITRLVNACSEDFRNLVTGALMTGCRYGELCALKAVAFDPTAGTITIGKSKTSRPRHIFLSDEGKRFFSNLLVGKLGSALAFERDKVASQATRDEPTTLVRAPWTDSDQFRPIKAACAAANITPAASFNVLRHTYASRLAMRGVPMSVIAAQLGHTSTRITEKHYAHLAPNYVSDTVRAAFGSLGIVNEKGGATISRIRAAG
jgi:integrase